MSENSQPFIEFYGFPVYEANPILLKYAKIYGKDLSTVDFQAYLFDNAIYVDDIKPLKMVRGA